MWISPEMYSQKAGKLSLGITDWFGVLPSTSTDPRVTIERASAGVEGSVQSTPVAHLLLLLKISRPNNDKFLRVDELAKGCLHVFGSQCRDLLL